MRTTHLAIALSLPLSLARTAHADECTHDRPTDPAGYAGIAYGSVVARSFATPEGNVRVHYVESGPHAPSLVSSGSDGVPDDVVRAGAVLEEAIAGFAKLGYRKPPSDGDYAPCASNGGDGRIDVYLVDMKGSDGLATRERYVTTAGAEVCTGAILVENAYDGRGYKDYDEGARTVIPHEYFHLIQNGYDARLDRWWAEGSAQWATKQLYPDLRDLERFLPAFFADLGRPLDSPPGGVTAPFLYGSAIFPVFLGEAFAPDVVLATHERLGKNGGKVLPSIDAVLTDRGSSLAAGFSQFAQWNAATGARAGGLGYADRASYPEAPVTKTEPVPFRVDDVFAGLGAKYLHVDDPAALTFEGDASRVRAFALPLVEGRIDLSHAVELPARTSGPSIVVVAGQSAVKTDVPFALLGAVPPVEPVDGGPPVVPEAPMADVGETAGCTCAQAASQRPLPSRAWLAGIALIAIARRSPLAAGASFNRRRRPPGSVARARALRRTRS